MGMYVEITGAMCELFQSRRIANQDPQNTWQNMDITQQKGHQDSGNIKHDQSSSH